MYWLKSDRLSYALAYQLPQLVALAYQLPQLVALAYQLPQLVGQAQSCLAVVR
jgi:hypothetical protein